MIESRWTIPFNFRISHKETEFRQLSVIHPQNQLFVADFYHKHSAQIIYQCSKSSFAIRHPSSVAKTVRFKDRLFVERKGSSQDSLEESGKEYEGLGSFFVYEKYSNIFKFYENYDYLNAERKFSTLTKLDIASCFDSIYTHTIAWATLGHEVAKENINSLGPTFGGQFDKLVQAMNRGETNGIVIGPEFSRVFAEIILQDVDQKLEAILSLDHGLQNKVNYEIFRYVDDYFVFCSDSQVSDCIKKCLADLLKGVKLTLSSEKSDSYDRPIITPLTIVKNRISDCLERRIVTRFDKKSSPDGGDEIQHFSVRVQGRSLITDYKAALKESGVRYKEVLNYTLAAIERRTHYIFREFKRNHPELRDERELVRALLGILEFSFFIYASQPRVNFTVRLTRIVSIVVDQLHEVNVSRDLKDQVFKHVFDSIHRHIKHTPHDRFHEHETLYLLLALNKLGRNYSVPERNLADFVGIEIDSHGEFSRSRRLSYFAISVYLLYVRNRNRYSRLRAYLEAEVREKFAERRPYIKSDSELVIAAIDLQCCPYVSDGLKADLAAYYGVETARIGFLASARSYWFTNWEGFDLSNELDKKRAREVY
ncbi:Retron-type reverse transcriptase [Jannaschia seosinensis]|uniref:Retron-type reverse transcriptase n=2 Tax=Jannaschia seosinensis TaxID=313367 RepID=A0A0M7BER5_9RHOB|nr:Retron-type reverse transcriptase [Jannaschia seosinensis]